jgi:hypothetical protein
MLDYYDDSTHLDHEECDIGVRNYVGDGSITISGTGYKYKLLNFF